MNRQIRPYGDRALRVEFDALPDVLALHAALSVTRPPGVVDIVPAARTVTVVVEPRVLPPETAATWIAHAQPQAVDERHEEVVDIDVDYSGEDIAEVARLTGLSVDEVIDVHTSSTWRVAFAGFAPGFGYLVTDHDRLHVPRRATPRTSVPAGAVALAGEFGGVYPRSGPGGWQLIGHTDAALWDETRDPPALLRPGTRVRFHRATPSGGRASGGRARWSSGDRAAIRDPSAERACERGSASEERARVSRPSGATDDASLTVIDPGMQALIEDLGRPGNASIGAARSGALDRAALRLANRLLGNEETAAAIELLYGGARMRFERPTWFVVTGARGPLALHPAEPSASGGAAAATEPIASARPDASHLVEPDTPTRASAGETLSIGPAEGGMRYLLALRGGIRAPLVLGSRSRDVGAGLGPAPLADGDTLAVGPDPGHGIPPIDALTVPSPPTDTVVVHVRPGPQADWFTPAATTRFYESEWRLSPESNRIGARLDLAEQGAEPPLGRAITAELPSEAMVPGAIQVPPAGIPVVLLADHPVTGGYPVIAVVADADLDLFAQLRPGQGVRFRHLR